MKKRLLNSTQMGCLSIALMDNLFPTPKKNELYVEDVSGDSSCIFYFELAYYNRLIQTIRNAYESGAFARSNNEDEWNDLMFSLQNAVEVSNFDKEQYRSHFLAED